MIAAAGTAFIVAIGAFIIGGIMYARGLYVPSQSEPSPIVITSDELQTKNGFAPELDVTLIKVSRQQLDGSTIVARVTSAHDLDPIDSMMLANSSANASFKLQRSESESEGEVDDASALRSRGDTFLLSLTDSKADEIRNSPGGMVEKVSLEAVFARPEGRQVVRMILNLDFRDVDQSANTDRGRQDESRSGEQPAPNEAPTDVEWVAQEIALMVDRGRGTMFFRAYSEGIEIVKSCTPDEEAYAKMLRREIDKARKKLGKATILRFIGRACGLWRAEELRINRERAESLAAAQKAAAEAVMSKATALIAMYVAGCALVAFLMFAIMLAILAIENHTLTLRAKAVDE